MKPSVVSKSFLLCVFLLFNADFSFAADAKAPTENGTAPSKSGFLEGDYVYLEEGYDGDITVESNGAVTFDILNTRTMSQCDIEMKTSDFKESKGVFKYSRPDCSLEARFSDHGKKVFITNKSCSDCGMHVTPTGAYKLD